MKTKKYLKNRIIKLRCAGEDFVLMQKYCGIYFYFQLIKKLKVTKHDFEPGKMKNKPSLLLLMLPLLNDCEVHITPDRLYFYIFIVPRCCRNTSTTLFKRQLCISISVQKALRLNQCFIPILLNTGAVKDHSRNVFSPVSRQLLNG